MSSRDTIDRDIIDRMKKMKFYPHKSKILPVNNATFVHPFQPMAHIKTNLNPFSERNGFPLRWVLHHVFDRPLGNKFHHLEIK